MRTLDKGLALSFVLAVTTAAALGISSSGFAAGRAVATTVSWKPLPKAPILGRSHEGVVWTGKEMIVWGGGWVGASGRSKALSDGAAYEPATRRWRRIAPPPPSLGSNALWTGSLVVAWGAKDPDGPSVGAVYDPRRDTWRRLPAGPLRRGGREGAALVWTGKELLVIGGTSGDAQATPVAAAVDPRTGSWRRLAALNRVSFFGGVRAVWDGHEVVVSGTLALCRPPRGSACDKVRPALLAYDPATNALRALSLTAAPLEAHQSLRLVGHRGRDVFFATVGDPGYPSSAVPRVLRYNPTTGRWHTSGVAPCPQPDPDQAISPGDPNVFYLSPCGASMFSARGPNSLAIYSAASDSWREITARSPLTARFPSAVVWTGTDLIAWSGSESKGHRATPADGASLDLSG